MKEHLFKTRRSRETRSFLSGVFRGLISPVEVYLPFRDPEAGRTSLEDMRSDWEAIGNDFRSAFSQVYEEAAERQSTERAPET